MGVKNCTERAGLFEQKTSREFRATMVKKYLKHAINQPRSTLKPKEDFSSGDQEIQSQKALTQRTSNMLSKHFAKSRSQSSLPGSQPSINSNIKFSANSQISKESRSTFRRKFYEEAQIQNQGKKHLAQIRDSAQFYHSFQEKIILEEKEKENSQEKLKIQNLEDPFLTGSVLVQITDYKKYLDTSDQIFDSGILAELEIQRSLRYDNLQFQTDPGLFQSIYMANSLLREEPELRPENMPFLDCSEIFGNFQLEEQPLQLNPNRKLLEQDLEEIKKIIEYSIIQNQVEEKKEESDQSQQQYVDQVNLRQKESQKGLETVVQEQISLQIKQHEQKASKKRQSQQSSIPLTENSFKTSQVKQQALIPKIQRSEKAISVQKFTIQNQQPELSQSSDPQIFLQAIIPMQKLEENIQSKKPQQLQFTATQHIQVTVKRQNQLHESEESEQLQSSQYLIDPRASQAANVFGKHSIKFHQLRNPAPRLEKPLLKMNDECRLSHEDEIRLSHPHPNK